MRIPKMCLKQSLYYSKWMLQIILSLTVLLYCASCSSMTPLFSLAVSTFWVFFSAYWIGNSMRIPKMCLKQSFSYYKWVFQAIFSLTVSSNCIFINSNIDSVFLSNCTGWPNKNARYCILKTKNDKCLKQKFY